MRYFTYMAEQAFKTTPTGERVFYHGGPWSRPYFIPDPETERRLFRKQLWLLRVLAGGLIIGQSVLFALVPQVLDEPLWFLVALAGVWSVFWLASQIVFWAELGRLRRMPTRLPLRNFFEEMARRHRPGMLWAGVIGCAVFLAWDVVMLLIGFNPAVAVSGIVIFGACGLGWGYALRLKRVRPDAVGAGAVTRLQERR